jgi:hypothetical protein
LDQQFAGTCVLGSDIYVFGGGDGEERESTCSTFKYSTEANT